MDCIFCKIVAGAIPAHTVYEDEQTLAFLDINPATRGHTLVIPKQHAPDLFSVPPEALTATALAAQKVARLLQQVVRPDGLNIVQNNGSAAGQVVMHYHVHLIPRWTGDGALRMWRPGQTDHAAFAALAEELRRAQEA
ncbi:HIT family protein [Kallotenue papyrolyticum]|uniref:HIT family protein n=1 Tax=Kallotenue papyrolyticum TaxID=1325125 RepID=UPI000478589F|nr:HIT family protein [Kallotenue papyrolyticum]